MPKELTKKQEKEVQKEVKKQLKIISKTKQLGSEFKKQASTGMIAGFSLLIALAWKDLIFKLIQNYTSIDLLEKYPFIADLYTAVIITIIGVIGILIISKWAQKPDDESK